MGPSKLKFASHQVGCPPDVYLGLVLSYERNECTIIEVVLH